MKNKKLFAILTLVCFMFTLMPVAAFAASDLYYTQETADVQAWITLDTNDYVVYNYTGAVADEKNNWTPANVTGTAGNNINVTMFAADGKGYIAIMNTNGTVATTDDTVVAKEFVTTAMVAKYTAGVAGRADYQMSSIINDEAKDSFLLENVDNAAAGESVTFVVNAKDATGAKSSFASGDFYVWAVDANGNISSALRVNTAIAGLSFATTGSGVDNVYKATGVVSDGATLELSFVRDGEYTIYAGVKGATTVESISDINKLVGASASTITVKDKAADPDTFRAALNKNADKAVDSVLGVVSVKATNVYSDAQTVTFTNAAGTALKGKTVTIDVNSSSIETNKTTATTDSLGQIKFKVSGSVEGTYEVILSIDGVDWTVEVTVGNTAAAYIETVTEPTAPVAQYGNWENNTKKTANETIEFEITDINGNIVTTNAGLENAAFNGTAGYTDNNGYIVLTEAPADVDFDEEDLKLEYNADSEVWWIDGANFNVEGKYAVKVILDNGAYATAEWEVKKFQTPVQLLMVTAPVVELGRNLQPDLYYVDANGTSKKVTVADSDVELAATGYAIAAFYEDLGAVSIKTDEKYAGSTINLTAVSERYDLVATATVTVAAEATDIKFMSNSLEVGVNNKVEWKVVDAEGNPVRLSDVAKIEVNYVVLDKPEDAKVSVYDLTPTNSFDGNNGEVAITSNKVGNVTIQAIAQVKVAEAGNTNVQTKYYTGTQIFAVGTAGVGDVVVMSVGSNEIVINDAKATIDAAPIVANSRTFVPFRALAEAFGAEVAYDEATQAVTAELNGVTVVMTIGSAEYTVNGEAKTADVAPFINGSRTMVPVRFAAEAFGIKVIPTYDENGATADILFNL